MLDWWHIVVLCSFSHLSQWDHSHCQVVILGANKFQLLFGNAERMINSEKICRFANFNWSSFFFFSPHENSLNLQNLNTWKEGMEGTSQQVVSGGDVEMKTSADGSVPPNTCSHYVKRKNRYCNAPLIPGTHPMQQLALNTKGTKWCGSHIPPSECPEGKKRVPCPMDPNQYHLFIQWMHWISTALCTRKI